MTPVLNRRKLRRQALQSLANIFEGNGTVRSIHYSCESFYGDDDRTSRRITAIGVYTAGNNESTGFSIAETAEALGIAKEDIEGEFERIEKKILEDFFSMIDTTETALWLHWNMRDTYYGFRALEHRARVLGLSPTVIDDSKKVDLANVIRNLEGPDYIETSSPRESTASERRPSKGLLEWQRRGGRLREPCLRQAPRLHARQGASNLEGCRASCIRVS